MIFILELLKNFMVEINKTTSTDRFHETDGVFILQQLHSIIVVKQGFCGRVVLGHSKVI